MRLWSVCWIVGAVSMALIVGSACGPVHEPADLVLTNGKVVSVDDAIGEAQAIAINGYSITAVGNSNEISAYVGDETQVIDLNGRLAIPGFIEGHGHYLSLGRAKMILDLTNATSWQEIVDMVGAAAANAEPGTWIEGRGWHQEKWSSTPEPNVDGVPLHVALSAVSPNNPVNLGHASGHASFANAIAMALAAIDRHTADPAGGTVVRDAAGNATGLMREAAQRLIGRAIGASRAGMSAGDREADFRRRVELAGQEALANGITSFQDAGVGFSMIDRYRALADAGELPVRIYAMVRGESNERMAELLPEYRTIPAGNDFLAVRSIKRQIDGALGSHGAWLLEPYIDIDSTGLVLETVEDIEGTAAIAFEHGYQVNTHAIGDRANREVLDLYERIFATDPSKSDLRWRIEHAQHLDPADIPRFAGLGVIASMQGVHATSDGPWIPRRLGNERGELTSYRWRDLIKAGAVVGSGTDVPVEDIDPIASFYSFVSRRMGNGQVFHAHQRMTRDEALRSYTTNNAHAAFEGHLKGSVTPGKLADIVVLSADIMTIPEEEIPHARVDLTLVGGEVRYRRE